MKKALVLLFSLVCTLAQAQKWDSLATQNTCTARGESAVVAIKNKLYLLGSRGVKPVEELDTKTNKWTTMAEPPLEMHHFQAVVFKDEIYVMGALTGAYPHEKPIENIYIFNPSKNEWRKGPAIPRLRGSAAVFVHNQKIYLLCGIIDGHWDGHVAWFDEYNPKTNEWKELPNAPHARDHISAAIIGQKVVVAGGRLSSAKINKVLELTVAETDLFDFATNQWTTVNNTNIPTQRAGAAVATLGTQAIFMGGESGSQVPAHSEVEAFDLKSMQWKPLAKLNQGRHGTGAAKIGQKIYIIAGVGKRGGSPELNTVEVYK